jgi:hypothetical protein
MAIPRKKNTDQVNLLTPRESIVSETVKLFTFSFSLLERLFAFEIPIIIPNVL